MPAFHVQRSRRIQAPVEKIKQALIDFRQWSAWSPWLITEPEASLTYSPTQGEVGSKYSWEGNLVGVGDMLLSVIKDDQLDMQLQFIKPFKSTARIVFNLVPQGDATEITWNMHGKLPFFMFFMVEKMKSWIGMDYERGLTMLKDYIEKGSVPSKLSIDGEAQLEGQRYIGIEHDCAIKDLGTVMKDDYTKLYGLLEEKNLPMDVIPFSITNSFDIVKSRANIISAVPVKESLELVPPFFLGEMPASRVLKVTHTGSYDHIGNGWAAAISYSRYKKIKCQKKPVGIERYLNDPAVTPTEELVTEILLPLKA